MQGSTVHFVLDHTVPNLAALGIEWPPYLRVSALKDAAPALTGEQDDWRVILALAALGGIDGYVTTDAAILDSPEEVVALAQTTLTLVVTAGVGQNPLRAVGLLLTYLTEIARQVAGQSPREASIYRITAARLGELRKGPEQRLAELAERRRMLPDELVSEARRRMGLGG